MIATEIQALWAKGVYDNPELHSDIEIEIAYNLLSGQAFSKTAVEWAKSVYSDPSDKKDLDIAVAYDIMKEARHQGTY